MRFAARWKDSVASVPPARSPSLPKTFTLSAADTSRQPSSLKKLAPRK
jgi:hypothetical protein